MLRSLIHQFVRPRVLSSFRYFHSTVTVKGTSVSVAEDGKKLYLWIDEEPERRYHSVWLKHNCQCPKCLSPFTDQVVVPVASLTLDTKITSAEIIGKFSFDTTCLGTTSFTSFTISFIHLFNQIVQSISLLQINPQEILTPDTAQLIG